MSEEKEYIDVAPSALEQSQENRVVKRALTPLPEPYISGMKLNSDVILGDLILNTIDGNNVIWVCTDIKGWWGQPDLDMPDLQRGYSDGSYDTDGRWKARQITLEGVFLPPSPSYVAIARDTLIRETSLVYRGAWLRTFEDPPRASFVRLDSKPDIQTINARGRTEFSIGLRAADPIKYEWDDSDPEGYSVVEIPVRNTGAGKNGTGVVNNIGNTEVSLILELSGGVTGPLTITNSTREELLLVIDPVANGDILEIDTYDREVALNGSIEGTRSKIDTLVDWIQLSPGLNTITVIDEGNAASNATLRVYYRSGWIG
jgi:hypothetical protein